MCCRSRLDLVKSIKDLQQQLDKANEGADKREAQLQQVENDLNAIATEMQRLGPKQQYLRFDATLLLTSMCINHAHSSTKCNRIAVPPSQATVH